VGLHYGTLLSLTLDEASLDVNSFQLRDQPEIYTLGHQPVKIITSQSMNVIYALSDQLWRIRLDDRLYIESILLPRLKTRIGAIAPFHFDQHVDRESIIVLAENKFMLYELDPSSCINIEKMMIGEVCIFCCISLILFLPSSCCIIYVRLPKEYYMTRQWIVPLL
jgi:hypothetical protein